MGSAIRAKRASLSNEILRLDWSFSSANTDYLTHGIHRYSGKFIPQIASQAIKLLSKPGDLILDPYCGSGTTLVEAISLGRQSCGIDINPLAVLIAAVKTTPVEVPKLNLLLRHLTNFASGLEGDDLFTQQTGVRDEPESRLNDPWFNKWFQRQVLLDLVALHNEIDAINDTRLKKIALVAFSDVLRRSSNAHQGYPNVMFDRHGGARPRPGRHFIKSLKQICEAVGSLNNVKNACWTDVSIVEGNAANMPIAAEVAQAVISHPPYIGSIPYAEYGALSLKWLGTDPKHLDRILTGGRRQTYDVLTRFAADYQKMIACSSRVLKAGGYLFLMVGNPTVKGQLVDLAEMTRSFASQAGFAEVATATRTAENRRANKMGDESILVFGKT